MKLLLLCLLPLAMGVPAVDKRLLLDTLNLGSLFNLDALKCDIQLMLDVVGTDPTEVACEQECHVILQEGHVLNYACPIVCHGFQSLVHVWHVVPDTTDPSVSKCHSSAPAVGRKRVLLDSLSGLDLSSLKCDIQLMVDTLGGDPTEAACEAECHKLITEGHLFNYACALVCHGFQNLVHVWHVVPSGTQCNSPSTAVLKKRALLGDLNAFDLSNLKCDVQLMLDALGGDPSEAACEAECHKLIIEGHLFNYACGLVCHGFQNLVHTWHVVPDTNDPLVSQCKSTATAVGRKRVLLDSLSGLNLSSLKCDIQLMVDALGGDPTETACEAECHKLITEGHLFNYACALVCHGFQNLVHVWHVVPSGTQCNSPSTAVIKKRALLGDLNAFDLSNLKCDVQLMLDALGGDPSEAACEAECHKLIIEGHLFNYACGLVCHGFQNLVHTWHVVPDTNDPLVSQCKSTATAVGKKRVLLDSLSGLNLSSLKCDIQLMVDALGGDPTETACEAECHKLITEGHLFNYACALVCHGFQNLVHVWHVVPSGTQCNSPSTAVIKKRALLGDLNAFDLSNLKCDVQLMLDALGGDPSEAACEAECHKLIIEGHLFNYACGLVCHGFQNLVHTWHVVPDTNDPLVSQCKSTATAAGKKRLILDSLTGFDLTNLKCDIQLMLDALGGDPSEAACEAECHKLLQQGHVLNYGCALVCHGFQNLVHLWHIVPDTTDPSVSQCGNVMTTTAGK